jgi:hydrogenase expression/formation protein HypD
MTGMSDARDPARARALAAAIARAAGSGAGGGRPWHVMEFCGGHTHTIARWGISSLLPPTVKLVHGPGCPVCVLPVGRIDQAIAMARDPRVILATFADLMRVPASGRLSLQAARAEGCDIRMVQGAGEALKLARQNPDREIVFLAIGFETTTPPTALAVLEAERAGLANFSVFCCHVTTPAAVEAILGGEDARAGRVQVDAVIGPGHVSLVTGSDYYRPLAEAYRLPIVIAGFEPVDLMEAVLMAVRQLAQQRSEVEVQYVRAVTAGGNRRAQEAMAQVFAPRAAFDWRGLGEIPLSALRLADAYARFDAEQRFRAPYRTVADHPACACADILRGVKEPRDCRIFGTGCTPDHPVGACMVSGEGACAAAWRYGSARFEPVRAPVQVSPAEAVSAGAALEGVS